jgi:RNA polymerase sigma-70 factor (ECF subfamily)
MATSPLSLGATGIMSLMTPEMSADEIDELAGRAKDGDRDALELLLAVVRPRVLRVCRGVLPHLPDAEDASQDALLRISEKIGSWNGRSRFTTWAHVVALNAGRSAYRRMRTQAIAAEPPPGLAQSDPRTTSVIAGTRLDLLDAMEKLEQAHPTLVEPLLLRDVYGMSYQDIASLTGSPVGTIKAQVHRGRQFTRPLLRERA